MWKKPNAHTNHVKYIKIKIKLTKLKINYFCKQTTNYGKKNKKIRATAHHDCWYKIILITPKTRTEKNY